MAYTKTTVLCGSKAQTKYFFAIMDNLQKTRRMVSEMCKILSTG
jgi:hypothetical protein